MQKEPPPIGILPHEPNNDILSLPPAQSAGIVVPNRQPLITPGVSRIALIGEAPGADEELQRTPFVGMSGRFLNGWLSRAGIIRDQCFVGNISQIRPPGNEISRFALDGPEICNGLEQLYADLALFNPHICVLLGKTALWAAKGVFNISDWRGSLFVSDVVGPFLGRKCIATFHPAACLRQYEWTPLLYFDLRKALRHSQSPGLAERVRELDVKPTFDGLCAMLDSILERKPRISCDLEGYWNNLTCISLARSPDSGFIVPFTNMDGSSYWPDVDQEVAIWQRLACIMADPAIEKIWQNGLYDRFVLTYGYGLVVNGNVEDTMLKSWEMYCELEKSLAFLCSIYLENEPFYKSERKTDSQEVHWRYCCKDSVNTYEICNHLEKFLTASQKSHYRFNHDLLHPLLYMELRGIRYDSDLAKQRLREVNAHIYDVQSKLDKVAGFGLPKGFDLPALQAIMCHKKKPDVPKKKYESCYANAVKVLSLTLPSPAQLTQVAIDCDLSLNIKSPTFKTYIYETLKLPQQFKRNPKTGEERLSTDYEALLKLSKHTKHEAVELALQLGTLRTRSQMLEIGADPDGRIRCGYNIVGTETGRITCYTSPTGSGYNLQTIPSLDALRPEGHPLRNGMRDLFRADEGYYLFQCDLSGADGWTVAASLASLGDATMLEDYRAGIKPAKVLCYMLRHGADSLNAKSRDEIRTLTKEVGKDDWDYFASKVGQHGSSYGMGKRKLANQIFILSEGKITMTESEAGDLQRLFFIRYRIKLWHDWATRQISRDPSIEAPNGFKRRFFGRPAEMLNEFLSHLPQVITTYATNKALHNLWTDPENRLDDGRLRVEPLHQVHDSILGQFRCEDTDWASQKIKKWFDNPLIVAGQRITIPYEGSVSTDWSMSKKIRDL